MFGGRLRTHVAIKCLRFGAMSVSGVRREKAALSSGCKPTRQPLQPEAIGAVMEVTKWLKPSISVSRIGDSASVQAVTRVNAEQASLEGLRTPAPECVAPSSWAGIRTPSHYLHTSGLMH